MSGTISSIQTNLSLVGQLATFFATSTIVLPAIALVSFFMLELLSTNLLNERRIMRYSIATYSLSLLSALLAVVFFSLSPNQFMDMHVVESQMASVFSVSSYHFELGILIDHYSLAYLSLIHLLCLAIASFSSRYLIQEPNASIFWKLEFIPTDIGTYFRLIVCGLGNGWDQFCFVDCFLQGTFRTS
jgi:hypothetical protein